MNSKIDINLIPSTCWYSNVRSNVSSKEWDRLRKDTYQKAGLKCSICGKPGRLECHEIFSYNDGVQKLMALQAICSNCHLCYHIGRASVIGKYDEAINHLSKINGWTNTQSTKYVSECFAVWAERSKQEWELDISLLETL